MLCEHCGHNDSNDVTCYTYNTRGVGGTTLVHKNWYCKKCEKSVHRTYINDVEQDAEFYPESLDHDV